MAEDYNDIAGRPPDPFVRARLRNPGAPARASVPLSGLLGDSDRSGRRRLYLNTKLDYYVEFATDDVVAVDSIPAETPPFVGLEATRVHLADDAVLDWTRSRPAGDAFAIEAVVRDETVQPQFTETWEARCPGVTEHFGQSAFRPCRGGGGHGGGTGPTTTGPWPQPTRDGAATCRCTGTCDTCAGPSCNTCGDACPSVATCGTCGRWTCDRGCSGDCGGTGGTWASCDGTCASCNGTCEASCGGTCDRATCAGFTCQGTCGRESCQTCEATCWASCETCQTCNCFTERLSDCAMC